MSKPLIEFRDRLALGRLRNEADGKPYSTRAGLFGTMQKLLKGENDTESDTVCEVEDG
jgi:hypothetical protein